MPVTRSCLAFCLCLLLTVALGPLAARAEEGAGGSDPQELNKRLARGVPNGSHPRCHRQRHGSRQAGLRPLSGRRRTLGHGRRLLDVAPPSGGAVRRAGRAHAPPPTGQKTGAKLVWASTTPIPKDEAKKQTPESIVERNAVAAKVMQRHGIAVDDLFAFITPHLAAAQNPNDVHFNAMGYEMLGGQVAQSILGSLKKVPP